MSIQSVKLEIVGRLLSIDNPKILGQILSIVKSEKEDFWQGLSKAGKDEIMEGLDQLDAGKRIPFETVMNKYRK